MTNVDVIGLGNQSTNGTGGQWGQYLDELPWSATVDAFYAHAPSHRYIYRANGQTWPASTIDDRFGKINGMKASKWLGRFQAVEQMIWEPGKPEIIRNHKFIGGEWIPEPGHSCYNLYIPPAVDVDEGDPSAAVYWVNLIRKVYPNDADHIIRYFAHRVQFPGVKVNHALVLGGKPRIGKDTILAPLRYAVGTNNFADISPDKVLARFNKFFQSVILRISEARDMGMNKFQFYNTMKSMVAAPPEMFTIDEKNLPTYDIANVTSIIITTNYLTDGMYLPPDDARYYVAWSDEAQNDELTEYCQRLWRWYETEGAHAYTHVAAYLHSLDLSHWNAKKPPPKTEAWHDMVGGGLAQESGDLADLLDQLGNPDAITLRAVIENATGAFHQFITDRTNRKLIGYRFSECAMSPVKNPNHPIESKRKFRWSFGKDHNGSAIAGSVYARENLTERDRIRVAQQAARSPKGIGRLNAPVEEYRPGHTTYAGDEESIEL
jgi:hypothetical protein